MKLVSPLLALAFTAGSTLALAASASSASTPAGAPPDGPRPPRGSPFVQALDTDRDHVLSAAEIAAAPTVLKALDTNADGVVTADELRPKPPADAPTPPADLPPPPAAGERPHPADPILLVLDADQDGALSASEIANASTSLLALDADKDGQLTRDEFHPLPPDGAPGDLPPPPPGL